MEYEDNTRVPFFLGLLYESVIFSDLLRCKASQYSSELYIQVSRFRPSLKEKKDPQGRGEGVPTDLRGELTESQLRNLKNLAKRRLQEVLTKSKNMKRQFAELCDSLSRLVGSSV